MRRLSILFVIAFLSPWMALAQEAQLRTISTTGESLINVPPDEVIVNVGVETFDPSLDNAKEANRAAAEKLMRALRAMKIEDKHIRTANLELEVRYHSREPHTQIEGYFARRGYAVTLKDPKQFEAVVDTALKNGANKLMGFEFLTNELRKHRDEARKMAIKAAKEKAVALAAELGCRVGAPRTIHDGGGGYVGYMGSRWGNAYGGNMSQNSMQVSGDAGSGGETLPLGQIGIRANVSVTFDLVPQ